MPSNELRLNGPGGELAMVHNGASPDGSYPAVQREDVTMSESERRANNRMAYDQAHALLTLTVNNVNGLLDAGIDPYDVVDMLMGEMSKPQVSRRNADLALVLAILELAKARHR